MDYIPQEWSWKQSDIQLGLENFQPCYEDCCRNLMRWYKDITTHNEPLRPIRHPKAQCNVSLAEYQKIEHAGGKNSEIYWQRQLQIGVENFQPCYDDCCRFLMKEYEDYTIHNKPLYLISHRCAQRDVTLAEYQQIEHAGGKDSKIYWERLKASKSTPQPQKKKQSVVYDMRKDPIWIKKTDELMRKNKSWARMVTRVRQKQERERQQQHRKSLSAKKREAIRSKHAAYMRERRRQMNLKQQEEQRAKDRERMRARREHMPDEEKELIREKDAAAKRQRRREKRELKSWLVEGYQRCCSTSR